VRRRIGGHPTRGDWRVAEDLVGEEASANGLVVLSGNNLVADCRNDFLPLLEQLANARACSVGAAALVLLEGVEEYLGDRPSTDKAAAKLHRTVVALLTKGS
jgi:hypothetical protein